MTGMGVDPEQLAEQIRRTTEDALRQAARIQQATQEPEQQREWIRQNNMIYGGLIAIGLILVQPFLTVTALDRSATICVLAFSTAIPLLAALILINRQEDFRRRPTASLVVRVAQSVALLLASVGTAAGFWHIMWPAGAAVIASSFAALMVHSAGFVGLERVTPAPAETPAQPPGA